MIVIQGAVRDIQKLSQLMYTFVSPSATLSHFLPLKDGNSNRDPLFWGKMYFYKFSICTQNTGPNLILTCC